MPGWKTASRAARRGGAALASLLLPLVLSRPATAAQQLVVQLDGLQLPIDLAQLAAWSRDPRRSQGELAVWLGLLDPASREGLVRLLTAPLLRDRSFGQQLLASWTGSQMLQEVGALLTSDDGRNSADSLLATLQALLQRQEQVTALELLQALPGERLTLQLDGLLQLADQWRSQLLWQQLALRHLQQLPLPRRQSRPPLQLDAPVRSHMPIRSPAPDAPTAADPRRLTLAVPHRPEPLPLEIWRSQRAEPSPWVLLMPGLGGSPEQLSWLASALAERGWPVVVLEHPGSNDQAMKASFDGERPPPEAETLPERLADLQAVLAAQSRGQLPALGPGRSGRQGVVLMGHSLGALTALMAASGPPERGLARRCDRALQRLPLTNLSRLLQCQLPRLGPLQTTGASPAGASSTGPWPLGTSPPGAAPTGAAPAGARPMQPVPAGSSRPAGSPAGSPVSQPPPILAVVAFNSFGSLLWPREGLRRLRMPVLLVGGSLDLVTPPLSEQLPLFLGTTHPRSRLVLVQGGSHFSPVKLARQGEALFRLGDELVGVEPQKVQDLLLNLTVEFLAGLQQPLLLSPQLRQQEGVNAYVLDRSRAWSWWHRLPRREGQQP